MRINDDLIKPYGKSYRNSKLFFGIKTSSLGIYVFLLKNFKNNRQIILRVM